MQLVSRKALLALLWSATLLVAGLAANPTSFRSWLVLAAAAIVLPLVMMWRWNEPRQTMSQSIQDALR